MLSSSRKFSSGTTKKVNENDITKISLEETIPWIPKPVFAKPSEFKCETQVTVLENGLKVASEPKFGSYCTVGGKSF